MRLPCAMLSLALLSGCGHHEAATARRLAVMPVSTMGPAGREGAALRRSLQRAAEARRDLEPIAATKVDRGIAAAGERPCESDACLAGAGRRVSAELVLATTLAGLGEMRLVRARLIHAADALVLHDLQKTVRRDSLAETAEDLTRRLFPRRKRAWYANWWVWTAVGLVASATAGTIWWAASRDEAQPDQGVTHLGDL